MNPATRSKIDGLLGEVRDLLETGEPNPVEKFLNEKTFRVPGARMLAAELWRRFLETVEDPSIWTKHRFNRELRQYRPVRNSTANRLYVYDVAIERETPAVSTDDLKCVCLGRSRHFFVNREGKWSEVSWLYLNRIGLTPAQIADAKSNPITIPDLLAGRE